MIRFLLRTLLGVPAWLAYIVIQIPLMLIGLPLVAVLALWMQIRAKYNGHVRTNPQLRFPAPFGLRLFYLWENDEDGVDGDPWTESNGEPKNPVWFEATASWSTWRKVFVWSAWRNSVGNARRVPFLGMDIKDPKDKVTALSPAGLAAMRAFCSTGPSSERVLTWWNEYRKLGPYLARYGYRFELKFPYPKFVNVHFSAPRYFWIGWRIAQQDKPNIDIGFALQLFAKL